MIPPVLWMFSNAPQFEPIAVTMSGGYFAAPVRTSDGKDHMLLVDSGSNESYVLKSALVERERKRDETQLRLDIGQYQVLGRAQPVDANNLPSSIGGMHVEGVVGMNILKYVQLEIDYDAETVRARFGPALAWSEPGHSTLILNRDADGLYAAEGKIGGKSVRLCIDTGATALAIDAKKVDVSKLEKLPASTMHTFNGSVETDRYLLDGIQLGDLAGSWMVASRQPWSNSDDGTIGTNRLGSSKVVIDFPGSCVYLSKPDPLSQAASQILGMPVQIDADGLRFKESVPRFFKPYSSVKILALRGIKSTEVVAALRKQSPTASQTLLKAFAAMRSPGLLTTERNGHTELVIIQVAD